MPRRAVAAVVALIIASASVLTMACEITCAARDAQSTSAHHSCHQQPGAQDGPVVSAIHVCGHDDETGPTDLERVISAFDTPAIAAPVTTVTPPMRDAFSHAAFVDSSPPAPFTLTSELRI
jgi:hypothetical protein